MNLPHPSIINYNPMKLLIIFVNVFLAAVVVYLAQTLTTEFVPFGLLLSGVGVALFIGESRLWNFTKKALLSCILFSIAFGFWVALFIKDHWVSPQQMFLTFMLMALPFNLFGLFLGMIIRGLTERLERLIHRNKTVSNQ
jgi:hypothetical protein